MGLNRRLQQHFEACTFQCALLIPKYVKGLRGKPSHKPQLSGGLHNLNGNSCQESLIQELPFSLIFRNNFNYLCKCCFFSP